MVNPLGIGMNLGTAPKGMAGAKRYISPGLGAVLGKRSDLGLRYVFDPARDASEGAFGATFRDFNDPADPGNASNRYGYRWRCATTLPAISLSDSDFNGQASADFSGGAAAIKLNPIIPQSCTIIQVFKFSQAAVSAVRTTLFGDRGAAGLFGYIQRANSVTNNLRLTLDSTSAGGDVNSWTTGWVDGEPQCIAYSVDGGTLASEIWSLGEMKAQHTHAAGIVNPNAQFLRLGAAQGGTSPLGSKMAMTAVFDQALAARDGGGNLLKPGLLRSLMVDLMNLYGI